MPHAVFLFNKMPDPEYLARKVESGVLRAAALPHFGPYEAIAFASGESHTDLRAAQLAVCIPGINCEDGLVIPFPVPPNIGLNRGLTVYGFLQIDPGNYAAFEAHVTERTDREDGGDDATSVASAAGVLGIPGVNAIVSVSSASARDLNDRYNSLVDTPLVRSATTSVVSVEGSHGFGNLALASLE